MDHLTRRAAQYIRMSTDRQDLSPLVQKEAIGAFACAHDYEIVRSYEDEGKSGLDLLHRPRLRQLLKDVASAGSFSAVLVYDVSRWGRFQDADAAAYYEYHCRLNGVQVIYVGESFPNDQTPAAVLLKSMRRVMAAEYSRDIAVKSRAGQERVVAMGFQMGPLPALGFRRCSVSADGSRRLMLEHGQRKAALTDRIEWVLAPDKEVDLVRRICKAYVTGLALEEIAGLVVAEGWRTDKGKALSTQGVKILFSNEALIGNFVWGAKSKRGKVIQCSPTRMDGCLPRIIDDETWKAMQARLKDKERKAYAAGRGVARTRNSSNASAQTPRQLRLPLERIFPSESLRRSLGTPQQLRDHTRAFGRALSQQLCASGVPAAFDTRSNVLSMWNTRIRIRLMWPNDATTWRLERSRRAHRTPYTLVARMLALYRPLDFLLFPEGTAPQSLLNPLPRDIPRDLSRYSCTSPAQLVSRIANICTASKQPCAPTRRSARVAHSADLRTRGARAA